MIASANASSIAGLVAVSRAAVAAAARPPARPLLKCSSSAPMPAGREQRIGKALLLLQQ